MFLESMLPALGLTLIRPLAAIAFLPLAGAKPLPAPLQIILALSVAMFSFQPGSTEGLRLIQVTFLSAITEAVIGFAIGLGLSMPIAAGRLGGELIGTAMGIGFSSLLDPAHGSPIPTLGQFLSLTAVAMFMSFGGPVLLIRIVSESYLVLPIGHPPDANIVTRLDNGVAAMLAGGLRIALPVLVATLGVQMAFAALARLAPQLNLFAVGFPATLIVGTLAFALAFPTIGAVMRQSWRVNLDWVSMIVSP